jgi:hypothetical protein
MIRSELVSKIKFYLNIEDEQVDQGLTDARLIELINDKYKELVVRAKQEGLNQYFRKVTTGTWEGSEVTYTLPAAAQNQEIITIRDITAGTPGPALDVGTIGSNSALSWETRNVIRWAPDGPASDVDLEIFYMASAEELLSDEAEPALIPPEHQILLVWAVAIEYRVIADDQVPRGWQDRLIELEANWHKSLSRGKPLDNVPWVSPRNSDQSTEGNL